MYSQKRTARIAGALYFIVVLTGFFNLGYVPSRLVVWDDPAATYNNIKAAEWLFRLGIYAGIVCYTAFLLLPLVLYKLLEKVNRTYAVAMVALAVVSVPVSLYNFIHKFSVLTLISDVGYINLELADLHDQVLLNLAYYSNGVKIASVFWGLWLLPFGYLIFRSGFLPKFLGVFLIAGCFGYLINFTGGFLFPEYKNLGIAGYVSLPATIGEVGICLWLLIIGVKKNKTNAVERV